MDLDGQPLIEVLRRAKRGQPFPLEFRLHVLCETLRAVHAFHERGARSGAVRPHGLSLQRVLVGYDGRVVVDAESARDSVDRISTSDGVFVGKLGYVAPEQAKGQPGDHRADVFAAGVMLWEAIALRRFTPKERTRAAVEARISGFEPRIQAAEPDVDPDLAVICDRALHVNPDLRYATAEEMRNALSSYLRTRFPPIRVRVIGETMRALFVPESVPPPPPRGIDATEEPTRVGDLSELIQSTLPALRSVPPPAADAATPQAPLAGAFPSVSPSSSGGTAPAEEEGEEPAGEGPNRRPLIIAVAALVVAVGTFLFSMSRTAPAVEVTPSPSPVEEPRSDLMPAPEPVGEPRSAPAPVETAEASVEASAQELATAAPRRSRPRVLAPRPSKAPAAAPPVLRHTIDEEDPFK